jgi:CubicO group peptidase (beta-lactamase class C family)
VSDESRSLPPRPSLRFLKLEARRRLTAGEFDTLHDAQLAIAREHGMSSWAVLKEAISGQPHPDSHALAQVRWLVSRFGGADDAGWEPPGRDELGEHFGEGFLARFQPWRLTAVLASRAALLSKEMVILEQEPLSVRAQAGGMQIEAVAEAAPAHRLAGLRVYPVGARVTDPRVARPPAGHAEGDVPAAASEIADEALTEEGLPGLVLGGGTGDEAWVTARGWADLDRPEVLRPEHRFPAPGVTKLITAVAALRLVADGRVGLDDPANDYLRTVRLADDAVTIRELLTHTGGIEVDSNPSELLADAVPDLAALAGPVLPVSERGKFTYSNTGYAALGQLIADVTGLSYAEAVAGLVLEPLGMSASSFPMTWPVADPVAVTGYRLLQDGIFAIAPRKLWTTPAAAGLWSTAADLVRFATRWSSLLPDPLAREALTPQADRTPRAGQIGLGWMLNRDKDVASHPGILPYGSASLMIHVSSGQACVALTNRQVPIEPVGARVIRALADDGE